MITRITVVALTVGLIGSAFTNAYLWRSTAVLENRLAETEKDRAFWRESADSTLQRAESLSKQLSDDARDRAASDKRHIEQFDRVVAVVDKQAASINELQARLAAAETPKKETRLAAVPAPEIYAPRSDTESEVVSLPVERIRSEVSRRAERFYKTEHVNGTGNTLVFDFNVDLEEPRARQGWVGRYEVTGVAWYQVYDSIWGGAFSTKREFFSAEVEVSGGAIRVLDFSRRARAAM